MSTSNGIITKPVSIKDVQQTIGNASGDLGTLCKSSTINKWSKYKPTIYKGLFPAQSSQYKADDGNCGLIVPSVSSYPALSSWFDSNSDWQYAPPTGGESSPYRLGDFNNYCHSSVSPFGTFNIGSTLYTSYSDKVQFVSRWSEAANDYSLKISDFSTVSSYYLGIVIVNNSGAFVGHASTTSPISALTDVIQEISYTNPSTVGTYYVLPVLSATSLGAYSNTQKTASFVPLPFSKGTLVLKDAASIKTSINTSFAVSMSYTGAQFTITVTNNTMYALNYTGGNMFLRYYPNGTSNNYTGQLYQYTIPAFSLNPSKSWTVTKSLTTSDISATNLENIYNNMGKWFTYTYVSCSTTQYSGESYSGLHMMG